jgi:hypothetical protein
VEESGCCRTKYLGWGARYFSRMQPTTLTLGHSPDPDDAFMFYALAKGLIPTHGFRFEHILQDIQTLNERATRGELDISAISIHAYAVCQRPIRAAAQRREHGRRLRPDAGGQTEIFPRRNRPQKIAVPGTMTSAFLALQLWLGKSAKEFDYVVVPFDQIFPPSVPESRRGPDHPRRPVDLSKRGTGGLRRPRRLVGHGKRRPAAAAGRQRDPQTF